MRFILCLVVVLEMTVVWQFSGCAIAPNASPSQYASTGSNMGTHAESHVFNHLGITMSIPDVAAHVTDNSGTSVVWLGQIPTQIANTKEFKIKVYLTRFSEKEFSHYYSARAADSSTSESFLDWSNRQHMELDSHEHTVGMAFRWDLRHQSNDYVISVFAVVTRTSSFEEDCEMTRRMIESIAFRRR